MYSGGGPSREDQVNTDISRWACVSRVLGILAAPEGLPGMALEEGAEAASTGKVCIPARWPQKDGHQLRSMPGLGRGGAEVPGHPHLSLILGPPVVWIR